MIAARSAKNTLGCLVGCAIGDLGAIFLFQSHFAPESIPQAFMDHSLDRGNELGHYYRVSFSKPLYLWKQLGAKEAFKTAVGMSMISMLLMEAAMNVVDYGMMGAPAITLSILPFTLGAGFLAAWPYNFWRLKKHGKCCH
jgi:hypothetical protein